MIGIIKDEDYTIVEFWPIFGKRCPEWAKFTYCKGNMSYGEWGIAWSKPYSIFSLPNLWIYRGNSCYPGLMPYLKDIFQDIRNWWARV